MPPRQLAAELKTGSVATAECCCSYNMMKLTRHLYSWNRATRITSITSSAPAQRTHRHHPPPDRSDQYYLSLTPGAWKTFNNEDQSFWCCTGTGVEEYSKLNDSIYWHDDEGLYVNLFIPSELNWAEKGLKVRQENSFPQQQSTALTVTSARPQTMALRLRVPVWAVGSRGEDQRQARGRLGRAG